MSSIFNTFFLFPGASKERVANLCVVSLKVVFLMMMMMMINELFLWYGLPKKGAWPYFQLGPLSEILTIKNLQHVASRVWTCAESEFRLCRMTLCSSDDHYTMAPHWMKLCSSDKRKFLKKFFWERMSL